MGQAKKMYLDQLLADEETGGDKYICGRHIDEEAIAAFFEREKESGICSYCARQGDVLLAKEMFNFIKAGIYSFYGDADDEGVAWDGAEGGHHGAMTIDTWDLLEEVKLYIDDEKLRSDVLNMLGNRNWSYVDPYKDRKNVELSYNWAAFKKVVMHRSRYVFLGSAQFPTGNENLPVDDILKDIARCADELNLFRLLKAGTLLYRCRQHADSRPLTLDSDFASPPDHLANSPNRMSPAGISMFYCAFDKLTCHAETLDRSQTALNRVSTGVFENRDELYLLDLTNLPELPSIFDPKNKAHYYSVLFLNSFVSDFTTPVNKAARPAIEYVPTQIVTEFFRYTYEELTGASIDGILYPSSRASGKNACVLFFNHKESLSSMNFRSDLIESELILGDQVC